MLKNMSVEWNGVPYYVFHSEDGFKHIILCATCLSVDRNLYMIDKECKSLMSDLGIKVTVRQRICWECVAMLKKVCKFISRAKLAHDILNNCELKTVNSLGSLSKLATSQTKILSIASNSSKRSAKPPPPLKPISKSLLKKLHLKTVPTEKVIKLLNNDVPVYMDVAQIKRIQGTKIVEESIPATVTPIEETGAVVSFNGHNIQTIAISPPKEADSDSVDNQNDQLVQASEPQTQNLNVAYSQNDLSVQVTEPQNQILYIINCQNDQSVQASEPEKEILYVIKIQNDQSVQPCEPEKQALYFVNCQNYQSVLAPEPETQNFVVVQASEPGTQNLDIIYIENDPELQASELNKQNLDIVSRQSDQSVHVAEPKKQNLNIVYSQNDQSVQAAESEKQNLDIVYSQNGDSVLACEPEKQNLDIVNSPNDQSVLPAEPEKKNLEVVNRQHNIQTIVSTEPVEQILDVVTKKNNETILTIDLEQPHAMNTQRRKTMVRHKPIIENTKTVNGQKLPSVETPKTIERLDAGSNTPILIHNVPPIVASESSACSDSIATTAENPQMLDNSIFNESVHKISVNNVAEIPISMNINVTISNEVKDSVITTGTPDVVNETEMDLATLKYVRENNHETALDEHPVCPDKELCENENIKVNQDSIITSKVRDVVNITEHNSASLGLVENNQYIIAVENSLISEEAPGNDKNIDHSMQNIVDKPSETLNSVKKDIAENYNSNEQSTESFEENEKSLDRSIETIAKQNANSDVNKDVPCNNNIGIEDQTQNTFQMEHETKQAQDTETQSDTNNTTGIANIYDDDFDFFDNLDIPEFNDISTTLIEKPEQESDQENLQMPSNDNQKAIGDCTTLAKIFEKNFKNNHLKCDNATIEKAEKEDNASSNTQQIQNKINHMIIERVYDRKTFKNNTSLKSMDDISQNSNLKNINDKKKQQLLVSRITAEAPSKIIHDEIPKQALIAPIYLDIDTVKDNTQKTDLINILKDHCYGLQRPFEFEENNYMFMGYHNLNNNCNKLLNTIQKPIKGRYNRHQFKNFNLYNDQKHIEKKESSKRQKHLLCKVPSSSMIKKKFVSIIKSHLEKKRDRTRENKKAQRAQTREDISRMPISKIEKDAQYNHRDAHVRNVVDAQNKPYDIYTNIKIENCNSQHVEFDGTTERCQVEHEEVYIKTEPIFGNGSLTDTVYNDSDSLTDSSSETAHIDTSENNYIEPSLKNNGESHENEFQEPNESVNNETKMKTTSLEKREDIVIKPDPDIDENSSFGTTIFDHVSYGSSDDNSQNESLGANYPKPSYNYYDLPAKSYDNEPETYENNSFGIGANTEATNIQLPTGFESNNITISFGASFLDDNLSTSPIEHTEENADAVTPKPGTSTDDYILNTSPDLLEPVYYTAWQDTTYEHAYKNISNVATKISRKGSEEKRKEAIPIKININDDNQLKKPVLPSNRVKKTKSKSSKSHKRKTKESDSDIYKTKLKFVAKKLKRDSENTDTRNEDNGNLIDGINYEKLLLRPVVMLEKINYLPDQVTIKTKIVEDPNDGSFLKDLESTSLEVPDSQFELPDQGNDQITSQTTEKETVTVDENAVVNNANLIDPALEEKNYITKLRSRVSPASTAKKALEKLKKYCQDSEIKQTIIKEKQSKTDAHSLYTLRILKEGEIEILRAKMRQEKIFENAKFKCLQCVRIFSYPGLKTHQKIHDVISGDHICPICESRYKTERRLKRHIHLHKRCFKCRLCPKEYLFSLDVWNHVRYTHPDYTKFGHPCPVCQKKFSFKSTLKRHMNLHKEVIGDTKIKSTKTFIKKNEKLPTEVTLEDSTITDTRACVIRMIRTDCDTTPKADTIHEERPENMSENISVDILNFTNLPNV